MNKTTKEETYSLNLSPKYAPQWGVWEIAREYICNAIDAAPGTLTIDTPTPDRLIITAPTVPHMGELFVIGEGTKTLGGETIGQFGEGSKIAALVATRSLGSSIMIEIPGKQVTFRIDPILGAESLVAVVNDSSHSHGMKVTIDAVGVRTTIEGKILDDRTTRHLPKKSIDKLTVFCKGVFISTLETHSVWDWNLNDVATNRDRSMVSEWDIIAKGGRYLAEHMTVDIAKTILQQDQTKSTIEFLMVNRCSSQLSVRAMADAFIDLHGPTAVIEDPLFEAKNQYLRNKGIKVVKVHEQVSYCLRNGGIKIASLIVHNDASLVSVDTAPYKNKIAMLRRLDKTIYATDVTILVFKPTERQLLGLANINDARLWLRQDLFEDGSEQALVSTYLHEINHFISGGADDTTMEFENMQDTTAGRLAMELLKHL